MQVTGTVTFVNDLSKKKATEKAFRYMAVEGFEIVDEGLIVKNDEYYSAWFDEGVDLGQYRKLPILPGDL